MEGNAALGTQTPINNARIAPMEPAPATRQEDLEVAMKSNEQRSPKVLSWSWITGPVTNNHADLVLLSHSFATGLVDSVSFSNWGVFCGMQTGNTVILGLSTATLPSNPHAWLTTLVSLASYLTGCFLTFRLTNLLLPSSSGALSSRLWLFTLFLTQGLLILLAAAILIPADIVPHNPPGLAVAATATSIIRNPRIVALLPPLAFQSGMQIAVSRLLKYNELPVNVLTSTYCDLMGDPQLFALHNIKRNRRVVSAVLVLAGAISGGWLMRSAAGTGGALFVAGGVKTVAAVLAFLLLRVDRKAIGAKV